MPATRKAQAMAERMDRERSRLERTGVRATGAIGIRARAAAIRALRAGADPRAAAREALRQAVPLFAKGMLAAHLQGYVRASRTAADALGRRVSFANAFDEAVDALFKRAAITSGKLKDLDGLFRIKA